MILSRSQITSLNRKKCITRYTITVTLTASDGQKYMLIDLVIDFIHILCALCKVNVMNLFSYFWYSTALIKSLLHSYILIRKKSLTSVLEPSGGGTPDFKSNALPIAPTKRLRATKINAIFILNTQTTIVAKLLYGDAIYNVSAAQNTLSAITYARNVHFN